MAGTSVEVVLGLPFLSFSEVHIRFAEKELFLEELHVCKSPTHQIESWAQLSSLLREETVTAIPSEHTDFANVSAPDLRPSFPNIPRSFNGPGRWLAASLWIN